MENCSKKREGWILRFWSQAFAGDDVSSVGVKPVEMKLCDSGMDTEPQTKATDCSSGWCPGMIWEVHGQLWHAQTEGGRDSSSWVTAGAGGALEYEGERLSLEGLKTTADSEISEFLETWILTFIFLYKTLRTFNTNLALCVLILNLGLINEL